MSDKLIPDDIDAIIEGHKNAKPEDLPKQIEHFMGQLDASRIEACSVVVVGGGPDPETVIVHCIDHDVHYPLMGDHP